MATRIAYTRGAFEKLRRTPEVGALLGAMADRVAAGCGPGYTSSGAEPGSTRTRASVYTETAEAMADNAAHNTLLTNLDRARI